MNLNAWLTLAAVFVSPILAVLISVLIEHRRRRRDGRMIVLRQLLVTRHLPADPAYSAAVNLVPVEFNDDQPVIQAYKEYQTAINATPGDNTDAIRKAGQSVVVKQTKLIFAIMRSLGLKASEADLPAEAYAAKGMIDRDDLYLQSLSAQIRTADTLEAMRGVNPTEGLLGRP